MNLCILILAVAGFLLAAVMVYFQKTRRVRQSFELIRGFATRTSLSALETDPVQPLLPTESDDFRAILDSISNTHLRVREYKNKYDDAERSLKALHQDMSDLLYIASHDLQSPLVAMIGFTSLAIRDHGTDLSPELRHSLERIRANAEHMRKLVQDLLEVSRIETKKNKFERFGPEADVRQIIDDYAIIDSNKDIIFEVGPLPQMYGDRQRLVAVMRHLIDNAVKYGGRHITVGHDPKRGYYVKDDGIGIEPGYFERIFRPGERLKDVAVEGTGMGLYFCQRVLRLHRGEISVESQGKNKGTLFYFTLGAEHDTAAR